MGNRCKPDTAPATVNKLRLITMSLRIIRGKAIDLRCTTYESGDQSKHVFLYVAEGDRLEYPIVCYSSVML